MSVAAAFSGMWHLLVLLCVCMCIYTNAQKKGLSTQVCIVLKTNLAVGVLCLWHAWCVHCPAVRPWTGQWRVDFQLKGTVTAGTLGLWILLFFIVMFVVFVQSQNCVQLLWSHVLQHTRLPCPFPYLGVCPSSCPLNQWCHPASSSVTPFCSCRASVSFLMSRLFESGGQSIGSSASASVLPMNIQGWFPLGLTGLISLQSKGLSRVFSSTTVWRHQFFGTQPSLWSISYICTWLLERP